MVLVALAAECAVEVVDLRPLGLHYSYYYLMMDRRLTLVVEHVGME